MDYGTTTTAMTIFIVVLLFVAVVISYDFLIGSNINYL